MSTATIQVSQEFFEKLKCIARVFNYPEGQEGKLFEDVASWVIENLCEENYWHGDWSSVCEGLEFNTRKEARAVASRINRKLNCSSTVESRADNESGTVKFWIDLGPR